LVAIFDADHVPHADFLAKMVAYFTDDKVGFVQTPQFYKNYGVNYLTRSSWEQQELFFGPICKGKNRLNAATMCGTNMLISRKALEEVGGMYTESIAEDFVTGLFMHAKATARYITRSTC
jgi:cellulose synthase (UDP-forming)